MRLTVPTYSKTTYSWSGLGSRQCFSAQGTVVCIRWDRLLAIRTWSQTLCLRLFGENRLSRSDWRRTGEDLPAVVGPELNLTERALDNLSPQRLRNANVFGAVWTGRDVNHGATLRSGNGCRPWALERSRLRITLANAGGGLQVGNLPVTKAGAELPELISRSRRSMRNTSRSLLPRQEIHSPGT